MAQKIRIAIVEDDAITAINLQQTLLKSGYEVAFAVGSGEQAVEMTMEDQPDLLLIDINLSGHLDGIAAVEQIQNRCNIPIVYLTAYAEKDIIDRAKATGPFGYLIKPLKKRELPATIEIALYKHRMETALKAANQRLEQEIAERKRVEKALWESEARDQAILKAIPDLMFRCNRNGIFLDYHANKTDDLLVSPDEFFGKPVTEALPPEVAQQTMHYLEQAYQSGEMQVFEYQLLLGNDLRDFEARVVAHDSENIWIIIRDINARKEMEIALRQAKEAAETADRAKSEFLANMSHEFRTPLNAILGYAQLFSRTEDLTQKQHEVMNIVRRSGEHLLAMISDILDLSKIEAQKIDLTPTEFYLPGFLKSLGDMVRVRTQRKGISFISEIASDVPEIVYGDEQRLRQILLNLLSNAIKFTTAGEVEFKVELQIADEGEVERSKTPGIRFQIQDTGTGIPSEHLEDIFLPFQQVGDRQFYSQGTGLGLAISRKLVRLMGSELHVKSTPGQGSIFWFDVGLPEVERGIAQDISQETIIQPADTPIVPPPRKDILILYHLIKIGDISEILKKATRLETETPQFAPFAVKLRRLANTFQLNVIQEFITPYMEKEP